MDNQVLSLFASDLATATVTAYRSGLRRFIIFYNQYHHNRFPLDEVTLCRFVAHLDAGNLTTQTIRLYLSALRFYQIAQGGIAGWSKAHTLDRSGTLQVLQNLYSIW